MKLRAPAPDVLRGVADGEAHGAPGSRGVFSEVEAYTPALDTWETLTPMPTPHHGVIAPVWNGKLYLPSGSKQQGA